MLVHTVLLSTGTACAMASKGVGVFKPPNTDRFLSIDYQVGIPFNTSTPSGIVGTVPVRGGNITGSLFNGHIVPNLTSSTERYLPVINNVTTTSYDGRFVFENEDGGRIFAEISGLTAYGQDLHGFGYAKLETTIQCLKWINSAMFIAEWQGIFFKGSGTTVEIFQVITGGRVDGKPIYAIPPSKDI